jgi:puromycin-sensitive aminopeptidase
MGRALVFSQLAKFGDPELTRVGKELFQKLQNDKNYALSGDLRRVVYIAAITSGNEKTFNEMTQMHREASSNEEKNRILRSLGFATDPILLQKTLEFALSDDVRSQDAIFGLESVAQNPLGRDLAWQFIQKNWPKLIESYKGLFLMTRLIKCMSYFSTEEKAAEVEAFFKSDPEVSKSRTLQQTLESIRLNSSWVKRDASAVRDYLGTLGSY